jgi:hypothetical protein
MKTTLKLVLVSGRLAMALALLMSCNRTYYPNSMVYSPLLTEKGQNVLSGNLNVGKDMTMLGLSNAHALSDHFALMGGMAFGSKNGNEQTIGALFNNVIKAAFGVDDREPATFQSHFFIAPGAFFKFSEHLVMEHFIGIGAGVINIEYNKISEFANLNYSEFFLHTGLGYVYDEYEFGISARLNQYRVNKLEYGNNMRMTTLNEIRPLQDLPRDLYLEPSIFFKTGGKKVKGQLRYTYAHPIDGEEYGFNKHQISFGLQLTKKQLDQANPK